MHRASQMVVEPHAPEAGLASYGGTSQHFANANAERIEQEVDLHPPSMSEPTCGVPLSRRSGTPSTAWFRTLDERVFGLHWPSVQHALRASR